MLFWSVYCFATLMIVSGATPFVETEIDYNGEFIIRKNVTLSDSVINKNFERHVNFDLLCLRNAFKY